MAVCLFEDLYSRCCVDLKIKALQARCCSHRSLGWAWPDWAWGGGVEWFPGELCRVPARASPAGPVPDTTAADFALDPEECGTL